jgi:DNA-binding CsgD family transcriptional regulator
VHRVLHTDVPPEAVRTYREQFAAHDLVSARALERRLTVAYELDVCTAEELGRDAFYNEFSLGFRLPCNFGVSAFRPSGPPHRLMLTFPRWPAAPALERAAAVLRVLAPAFAAGVEAVSRLTGAAGELGRVLDLLAEPTLVCDRRGEVLHRNPAAAGLLAEVRARGRPRGGGRGAGRAAGAGGGRGRAAARAPRRARGGRAAGGRARVRGRGAAPPRARLLHRGGHAGAGRAGVGDGRAREPARRRERGRARRRTAVTPVSRPPAGGAAGWRERFGLTAQECAVAELMAARRTDAEIAAALGISPNTARTHAERVRRKLGVARRTEVAELLAGRA